MPRVTVERLSLAQARRIALGAQGFAVARPSGRVDRRHVRTLIDRVGLIQVDSVNVFVRSQELPLWSRLGPHPRDLLAKMAHDGELFEYWAHEASILPVRHHHLFRWRMDDRHWVTSHASKEVTKHPGYLRAVLAEVEARGPLAASELDDPGDRGGPWWGWNRGKQALELLFWQGRLAARRRASFEREYDLVERVIPADVLAREPVPADDARRELLALAGHSLGVGTAADLADYYRIKPPVARPLIADLVAAGRLLPVSVEGWKDPAYLAPDAITPRRIEAATVLSPFDPVVWFRPRAERLFGFTYRLEIYTPAPKRVFGYYVLPFLLGDEIVARLDLKADRPAGSLLVQAAWIEPGISASPAEVTAAVHAELTALADWLGLAQVRVTPKGNLAADLARAVSPRLGRSQSKPGPNAL